MVGPDTPELAPGSGFIHGEVFMPVPLSFTGGIPEIYDRYIFPVNIKKFAMELGQVVAELNSKRVLEVAAGTGAGSDCVLQQLDEGVEYTLTDISSDMLIQAHRHFADRAIKIEVADACDLPYDADEFDTVICQFGMMYFEDAERAMDELFRVLTPGGHLVFSVWDSLEHHPFSRLARDLLSRYAPELNSRFLDFPYSWCSLDAMKSRLEMAGFRRINFTITRHTCEPEPCRQTVESILHGTPLGLELDACGVDRQTLTDQLTAELEQRVGGERLEGVARQGIIVTAS